MLDPFVVAHPELLTDEADIVLVAKVVVARADPSPPFPPLWVFIPSTIFPLFPFTEGIFVVETDSSGAEILGLLVKVFS